MVSKTYSLSKESYQELHKSFQIHLSDEGKAIHLGYFVNNLGLKEEPYLYKNCVLHFVHSNSLLRVHSLKLKSIKRAVSKIERKLGVTLE